MPSSGLPIENIVLHGDDAATQKTARYIEECAKRAMKLGLFAEWLESFVGAWNKTKDPIQSANAGLIEWDM
jgi:hypothetical protein